jgi:hypothetical protein
MSLPSLSSSAQRHCCAMLLSFFSALSWLHTAIGLAHFTVEEAARRLGPAPESGPRLPRQNQTSERAQALPRETGRAPALRSRTAHQLGSSPAVPKYDDLVFTRGDNSRIHSALGFGRLKRHPGFTPAWIASDSPGDTSLPKVGERARKTRHLVVVARPFLLDLAAQRLGRPARFPLCSS